ncbi:uncharacterized protein PITG_11798 [Phytophthora infestans T30-4]|uniref:Peptidase S1 domain-containing protein n=1 Tax=Phytophthora infestans (strain T30-4) TaxID=403677 RepID=D0NHU9_PHYIT|nr:uncharacterized protein PITG_11798 [Phytophthora infestans T30-4]EEY58824.1 hypothetical protein PITG_11798 [Phytophthora infestans T30-4]|eukprot:XP_002901297.1 hypothetical protein PITG_11798 [Phytophthora infestans T30-4]
MVGQTLTSASTLTWEPYILLTLKYVTTAVSCLDWFWVDTYVPLEAKQSKKGGSQKAEKIRVVEVFEHPKFSSTWLTNDVVVLKLEKSSSHKPARLGDADGSDDKLKTKATVLGWGEVQFRLEGVQACVGLEFLLLAPGVYLCAGVLPGSQRKSHALMLQVTKHGCFVSDESLVQMPL